MNNSDMNELLVETATNVRWIKERLESSVADQKVINAELSKEIAQVKARVWYISGGLIAAQALFASFIGVFKK